MLRPLRAALCALALLVVPADSALAAARPAVLPAVTRTLQAAAARDRTCAQAPATGRGLGSAAYRAPMSGYLTVALSGRGDWDLVLRDAASGRRLVASQGFGGDELAQTWVGAGQRIVAEGCRRAGAARSARVAFRLADVAPPKASAGPAQLVRVQGERDKIAALEAQGFDVSHNAGAGWADVVVAGPSQLAKLRATGLQLTTRVADLAAEDRRTATADRAYGASVGRSPLPTGRTDYRTYEDFQAEMKALVEQHPGLVRPVSFGKTYQGREMTGVEIARDVDGTDGRPVYFLMGNHHAREWPSGEAAMEFAHLLVDGRGEPRIASLLDRERVVILPIVNVDGYISSRSAFDPGDSLAGQDPNATLGEAIAPPGGAFAYRRKNCDGEISGPETPCELAWGVDPNRNYGNLWGGPGSSADVTSQSYHGPGPRSEPEVQNVWNYARTHQVTMLMTLHNVAALVLRPPGLHDGGLAPDEQRMKQIGDAMGKAAGYTSQYSWQLYDTAGTTEDDTYAATGGYGYTIEMGPPDGNFHMPYETGVVKEWTGDNDHAHGQGGLREALLIAAESAADPADHAILQGTAPAGKVLRLHKAFDTRTSPFCPKGVEPVVSVDQVPNGGAACAGSEHDPLTLHDTLDSTTSVPASGAFSWHVNQSTRPFVGGGAVKEVVEDGAPIATFSGQPGAPTGDVDHPFTLASETGAQKLHIHLQPTLPEDYDLTVLRKEADGSLKTVGTSGNPPGLPEDVLLDSPEPGDYVVRVTYFAGASGAYDVTVTPTVVAQRFVATGTKEAYTLTCETPEGQVLEQHPLVIDRGQVVDVRLGCGAAPSTLADGTPLPGDGAVPASAGAAGPGRAAPRAAALKLLGAKRVRVTRRGRAALRVACPGTVAQACQGTLVLRRGSGKRAVTLGRGRFRAAPGTVGSVTVRLRATARRSLARRGRLAARAVLSGTAGATALGGGRAVTLARAR